MPKHQHAYLTIDSDLSSPMAFCVECEHETTVRENGRLNCCGRPVSEIFAAPRPVRNRTERTFSASQIIREHGLCSTADVARMLDVSTATVRKRVRAGKLQAHRFGNVLLLPYEQFNRSFATGPLRPIQTKTSHAFSDFADRYGLSCSSLASACGCSKTSAHRLLRGRTMQSAFDRSRPGMIRCVTAFLADLGCDKKTIDAEIERLFKDR